MSAQRRTFCFKRFTGQNGFWFEDDLFLVSADDSGLRQTLMEAERTCLGVKTSNLYGIALPESDSCLARKSLGGCVKNPFLPRPAREVVNLLRGFKLTRSC